jgi:class 3 adenylate cyclase/predicted ATPase
MSSEREQIEAMINGLEAQRGLLGDSVVEAALDPLCAKLATLAPAAGTVPAEQVLKQVTVLFIDIVGSTNLSQHLDPEELHSVMDSALAEYRDIVATHHGRVLNYMGDGLLAAFGADGAREDDAERAVYAGLALIEQGRVQGDAVRQRFGREGFNVRVGLHTGPVLLGGGVDAEGSIRGLAVNVAARMEQTASAGGLRVSHDTYRHVRGVFEVTSQAPIEVKGVDQPVKSYLVHRAKERAFRKPMRGIEGVETRIVGRDAELEQLQDAFKKLYTEGGFHAVTVVGEAGVGKSRLVEEFENWAEERPESFCLFQGRAQPQTQSQPYGLLRDILAARFEIEDVDNMVVARQKIEHGIVPLFLADQGEALGQSQAHALGHLVGVDFADSPHIQGMCSDNGRIDSRQLRNRGFHVAAELFRRMSSQGSVPVVLQLDDLHWADDGSLDFLSYLIQVNGDIPMLVVGLARPTLFERRSEWFHPENVHQRLDLHPLDKGYSRELAIELLKKLPEIPAALRELITGGAEGNPFYMEELVKMLVDEGAIQTEGEHWSVVPDRLLATHVPATLTGVLQARLDSLEPAEKLALQQASVIGIRFWDEALTAIDAEAPAALPGLIRRELTFPSPNTLLEGSREYAFKHQILHQVTYDTLLKSTRREYHARMAAWLAGLQNSRAKDFLGAAAEQFEKAGDSLNASEYYARAAEHAAARYAHDAALESSANALALLGSQESPETCELRWRLLDVRERTLYTQGKRAEQGAALDALLKVAEMLDDDHRRAKLALRRSQRSSHLRDWRAVELYAREAILLAEKVQDHHQRLNAKRLLAFALSDRGEIPAAAALAEECLGEARTRGLRLEEALALNALASIANTRGDLLASLSFNEQLLVLVRELGNRANEAIGLMVIGDLWLQLGRFTDARQHLEEALNLFRAIGFRVHESSCLIDLSRLASYQGDDTQALARARSALDIAREIPSEYHEKWALWELANAALALGRDQEAVRAFESNLDKARALRDPYEYYCTAGLARVGLAQGDLAAALSHVERILAYLDGGGDLDSTVPARFILLTCYQVLERLADTRASKTLALAHSQLQEMAQRITDTSLRGSFLNNIPEHREIVAAWCALQTKGCQ